MKSGTVLLVLAGVAAFVYFSKGASAATDGGGSVNWAGQDYPLSQVQKYPQGGSLNMPATKASAYALTAPNIDYGTFTAAQMEQLISGKAVLQGSTTTKIENIDGGNQLLQVAPSVRNAQGQTAFDVQIAQNFAKQGLTVSSGNTFSQAQVTAMNASLAAKNAVLKKK